MTYHIRLLDREGAHLTDHHEDTLQAARDKARYLMTDEFATACGSTHERLGTEKVVVVRGGESVFELVRAG